MPDNETGIEDPSLMQRIALERQLLARIKGPPTGIPRRQRDGPCRLSFSQQRLWFLEQMEGELTANNMPFTWRLRGALNEEALRRALEEIVRRHEALRTTFAVIDDDPVQIIRTIERFELNVEDVRSRDSEQRESEIQQRCRSEAERPFDLTADLMMRASLLRLAEDEHLLLLTMHHIASDGWSLQVLWRELSLLYDAYCHGTDPQLPELAVQYADYAVWQRSELQGQRLEPLLQYWREQLDGVAPLELPTDHPRPPVPSYRGGRHDFELPSGLVEKLKSLSQAEGVTLQMTMLAGFQTLLSRYSGQDDIAVGTPTAGRDYAELEDQIGFFLNTLVLRTDLTGDPTFRELLHRVRKVSLGAYDHQGLPFERLVEELQPERHLSRGPLAQVLFQLLSFSDEPLALGDLDVSRLPASSQRVRFDLEMHLREHRQSVAGIVAYSTDLFDHTTIARLLDHFVRLLEGIVADADQRISEMPLLTEAERHELLVQFNDTAADYPHDKCLHHLFEEQAARSPDSIAVVFGDQQLTYYELNKQANQLAHYLRGLGVGPETRVGLCLERSPELVVGILGILKAGAAYVPLDPALPRERLQFMLDDSCPSAVVTTGLCWKRGLTLSGHTQYTEKPECPPKGQTHFPTKPRSLLDAEAEKGKTLAVVRLDQDSHRIASSANGNIAIEMDPSDPAYVIYTSGSTGSPKGVVGLHRGAINRLCWMWTAYPFEPHEICCQKTTLSFVDSVCEILGPLLRGVPTIVIPDAVVKDPKRLVEMLADHEVTRVVLVPSLLMTLLETHAHLDDHLPRLTHWVSSGERLAPDVLERFRAQAPHAKIINLYGSSEVSADVTCFDTRNPSIGESIPIGRPISNTQVYVLDNRQKPVPIGVPGELYVGGAGLARGYLNRPQLTAEKFVPNPFDEDPDSQLYRTGDLCRWRADGDLDFLGRLDDQVKLRGFRVELGEIQTVLNEHPEIAQSLVTLREDSPGDKQLVGYYVATDDADLNVSDLTRFLRKKLPDYMIPSAFVALEAFPLTESGKVKRRALPAPDDVRPQLQNAYVAPRNSMEEQLSEIWSDVLDVDRVGIHDDFFDLGGHSLLAVRLFSQLEKRIGKNIPLATLFQAPSIARLADVISNQSPQDCSNEGARPQSDRSVLSSAVEIQSETSATPLFVVSPGAVLFLKKLAQHLAPIRPLYGLQSPGLDSDDDELLDRVEAIAASHLRELRRIQPRGPYLLSGRCFGGHVAFEMARQLVSQGETIRALIVFDSSAPHESGVPLPGSQYGTPADRVGRAWSHVQSGELPATLWRKALQRWQRIGTRLSDLRIEWFASPEVRRMRRRHLANREAVKYYRAKPYPGNVMLIRSEEFAAVSRKQFHLRWENLALGGFQWRQVPGSHSRMFEEPVVKDLADVIEQCIAKTS